MEYYLQLGWRYVEDGGSLVVVVKEAKATGHRFST
jgi:hypothetical protein